MEKLKKRLLKKIDDMGSYEERLDFLNRQFLKAKTGMEESIILDMIVQLKFYGK